MTFNGPELAPAIFTPAELRKILAVCPANLLPHIVIGASSGKDEVGAKDERDQNGRVFKDAGHGRSVGWLLGFASADDVERAVGFANMADHRAVETWVGSPRRWRTFRYQP